MNFSKSFLSSNFGIVFSSIFITIVLVLVAVFGFFLWWVDVKKRTIKDFFKIIKNFIFKVCGQISELFSGDEVKTVYSDKTMNYSGTEFLPIPQKAPTDKYTYEFLGWDKNGVDKDGNVIVKAIYLQKVQKCYINVYNDDRQTLLGSYEVEFGSGVNLSDIAPKKPDTKEFSYEFLGWDKDITAFYKNENVYAVYKAIPKKFTYTFYDDDKTSVISQGTAIYGTPIVAPPNPVKQSGDGKIYNFVGFANYTDDMTLTKDCSFYAVYESIPESTVFATSVVTNEKSLPQEPVREFDEESPLAKKQKQIEESLSEKAPDGEEAKKSSFDAELITSNEVKVEAEVVDAAGEVVGFGNSNVGGDDEKPLMFDVKKQSYKGESDSENAAEENDAEDSAVDSEVGADEIVVSEVTEKDNVEESNESKEVGSGAGDEAAGSETADDLNGEKNEPNTSEAEKSDEQAEKKQAKDEKKGEPKEENKFLSFLYNRRKIVKKDDDKDSKK